MTRHLLGTFALLSITTLAPGCFLVGRAVTEGRIEGRLSEIDQMPPTTDARAISRVLAELAELEDEIATEDIFPHRRAELDQRLVASARGYRVRCARAMADPRDAMALLAPLAGQAATDPAIGDTIDAALDGIAAFYQARHRERGTYRLSPEERRESRLRMAELEGGGYTSDLEGQCIFSNRPFGRDDAPNDQLSVRFHGDSRVFVRCYLDHVHFHPNGRFLVEAISGDAVMRLPAGELEDLDEQNGYLDFELFPEGPGHFVPEEDRLSLIRMELFYVYSPDDHVVFEDGALRLRPEWRRRHLVVGALAWRGPGSGDEGRLAARQ